MPMPSKRRSVLAHSSVETYTPPGTRLASVVTAGGVGRGATLASLGENARVWICAHCTRMCGHVYV